MAEKETKQCPFCCEEIHADAIKCKHCSSDLRKAIVKIDETYGNLMLAIPIVFILDIILSRITNKDFF
jgi:hypothetical protein